MESFNSEQNVFHGPASPVGPGSLWEMMNLRPFLGCWVRPWILTTGGLAANLYWMSLLTLNLQTSESSWLDFLPSVIPGIQAISKFWQLLLKIYSESNTFHLLHWYHPVLKLYLYSLDFVSRLLCPLLSFYSLSSTQETAREERVSFCLKSSYGFPAYSQQNPQGTTWWPLPLSSVTSVLHPTYPCSLFSRHTGFFDLWRGNKSRCSSFSCLWEPSFLHMSAQLVLSCLRGLGFDISSAFLSHLT